MATPMYGTVARMRVKPGSEAALRKLTEEQARDIPGLVGDYVYRIDNEPDVYYLAVMFESKEAYVSNAQSPEQHARYQQYREYLQDDPEWHDGEIVSSVTMR